MSSRFISFSLNRQTRHLHRRATDTSAVITDFVKDAEPCHDDLVLRAATLYNTGKIFPVFKSAVSRLIHMHRFTKLQRQRRRHRGESGARNFEFKRAYLDSDSLAIHFCPECPARLVSDNRQPVIKIIAGGARSTRGRIILETFLRRVRYT